MILKISPESEVLKNTIEDLIEVLGIDFYVLAETFFALALEYADALLENNREADDARHLAAVRELKKN
jgi:hypothetical protein